MLHLKENPRLKDFQDYVSQMLTERGFKNQTSAETFMLFLEECGEMAKAARKASKMRIDKNSKEHNLDHEIADVFIYLLTICDKYNIDLEAAFREKEELNKQRTWA